MLETDRGAVRRLYKSQIAPLNVIIIIIIIVVGVMVMMMMMMMMMMQDC